MPPVLASPMPPGTARTRSSETQMDTGRTPPGKYAPAGEAMTRNRYSLAGFTPRPTSVPIMKGRRYSDSSPPCAGTQSWSWATSASHASMNVSTGSSGIARRRAERWKRRAFWSGRKVATEPSGWR